MIYHRVWRLINEIRSTRWQTTLDKNWITIAKTIFIFVISARLYILGTLKNNADVLHQSWLRNLLYWSVRVVPGLITYLFTCDFDQYSWEWAFEVFYWKPVLINKAKMNIGNVWLLSLKISWFGNYSMVSHVHLSVVAIKGILNG